MSDRTKDTLCWILVPCLLIGAYLYAAYLDERDSVRVEAKK